MQQVGIVLSAPDRRGSLIDIIDFIRPSDVPAMVQRRELTLATKPDKTLKFPLERFIKTTTNDQAKQQAQDTMSLLSVEKGKAGFNPFHLIRLGTLFEFDDCYRNGLDIVDEGDVLKDYWSKVALDFGAALIATIGYMSLS